MLIEPLTSRHNREAFDCGVESLNVYLKRFARQNADKNLGVTYAAVLTPGASFIAGYYTLAASSIVRTDLPETGLPNYPIPSALLGRLAVDKQQQGKGIGGLLLVDALRRANVSSEALGLFAVEVLALDDTARAFYRRYGFAPMTDDPLHLYLPIKAIRKMFPSA